MPKYSGNDYELRVCRLKMEDKGEYLVRAENSYGSREEHAFLNVEGQSASTLYGSNCRVTKHTVSFTGIDTTTKTTKMRFVIYRSR